MPISGRPSAEELYTPEDDVTQLNADGLQIQVASKGVPMTRRDAIKWGLVPDPNAPTTGPRETKEGARRPAGRQAPNEQDEADATPPPRGANAPARPPVPGATPGEAAP